MLESEEFPLILSPNLGCPEIISAEALMARRTIRLVVATQQSGLRGPPDRILGGALHLRSCSEASWQIPLQVAGPPQEIPDWNLLTSFPSLEATREMISSELHYQILGDQTRYWRVDGRIEPAHLASRPHEDGKAFPELFDLVLEDESSGQEKVNYHAVQIVARFPTEARFIHLTDLHVSQRNDEILDEVLMAKSELPRDRLRQQYVNFNENLRAFIHRANALADEGELDFVVITGDLVDYAFPGWDANRDESENNWKTFVNIVTGGGKEPSRDNHGINVPIFTSTGNHDWRLYPYDPKIHCRAFGLDRKILRGYHYAYFDSRDYPSSDLARTARGLAGVAHRTAAKVKTAVSSLAANRVIPWIFHMVAILGLGGVGLRRGQWQYGVILVAVEGLLLLGSRFIRRWTRWLADLAVSNPLLAEARALHYYLRHVNPYFDYAFRYGRHSFIVMDSGADVFTADLLDGKQAETLKRMSKKDNILGGSPDSRAFDSQRKYYNWSQIVWLENVLAMCQQHEDDSRTFLFLHAPPLNPPKRPRSTWIEFRESERKKNHFWLDESNSTLRCGTVNRCLRQLLYLGKKKNPWISEFDCNLTFGTVNHYLRQFLYLCMGYCEGELGTERVEPRVRKVDIVFCGHAHTNIEFRIAKEWIRQYQEHAIRVYCDAYSQTRAQHPSGDWWPKHTPLIVQTAACGLKGANAETPPYFRPVYVDSGGQIRSFGAKDGNNHDVPWSGLYSPVTLGQLIVSGLKTCRRWLGQCRGYVRDSWTEFIRKITRRYGYA